MCSMRLLINFPWEWIKVSSVDDAFDATRISEANSGNYVRTLRMLILSSEV